MAFGCGVTGLGRLKLTKLGAVACHDAERVTGELKPSCESTVTTDVVVDPWLIDSTLGAAVTVKSGVRT
jgi:hypothetical protein